MSSAPSFTIAPAIQVQRRTWQTFTENGVLFRFAPFSKNGRTYLQITYRDASGRKTYWSKCRKKMKKRAQDLSVNVINGRTAMSQFEESDRVAYLRCLELAAGTGKPLELIVGEYTDSVQILRKALPSDYPIPSFSSLAQFFLEHHPRNITPRNVPDLVKDLVATRSADGAGDRWIRSLKSQLKRFAEFWTGPLHLLRAPELNTWLRSLKDLKGKLLCPRTRTNYRGAIVELVHYAQANGHLARTWNELKSVDAIEVPDVEIRVLAPDQYTRLLAAAPPSLVPFVLLAGRAGLRHEELARKATPKKRRLDWKDIKLDRGICYVPESVSKKGEARTVPLDDKLVSWLRFHAKTSGPVCSLVNASNALFRAKKKAGIPASKNETRNTLRKSFISYRKVLIKDIARVADEAGTSVAKIKSNYGAPVEESDAAAWFNIGHDRAEVLPLFAWANRR